MANKSKKEYLSMLKSDKWQDRVEAIENLNDGDSVFRDGLLDPHDIVRLKSAERISEDNLMLVEPLLDDQIARVVATACKRVDPKLLAVEKLMKHDSPVVTPEVAQRVPIEMLSAMCGDDWVLSKMEIAKRISLDDIGIFVMDTYPEVSKIAKERVEKAK